MARVKLLITVDKIVSTNLQPAAGASVQVVVRATGTATTVYVNETGGSTVSNPLVTDANGRVNGWVDEGSYQLNVSGSGITSYSVMYEAVNGATNLDHPGTRVTVNTLPGDRLTAASVTGAKIANSTIDSKHLTDAAFPLGAILAWWQPSKPGGGYNYPAGWALCNGQSLISPAHDFSGGGTITLPNLLDAVPRGADPAKTYAQAATSSTAGGLNAVWGSNAIDLTHRHYTDHYHLIAAHSHHVQDHQHYMAHAHGVWIPDHAHGIPLTKAGYGGSSIGVAPTSGNTYGYGGVGVSTDGGNRNYTDGNGGIYTDNQSGGTNTGYASASGSSDGYSGYSLASTDIRDKSVGVLYIMKVKNT